MNKTDLSVSPWVATLKRISQREKGCESKSAPKGKPSTNCKIVLKKKVSLPRSKVCHTDTVKTAGKCQVKRINEHQQFYTNRYSVLAIDKLPQVDDSADRPPAGLNICNIRHKLSMLECASGVVSRKFRLTKTQTLRLTKTNKPFPLVFKKHKKMSQSNQSQHTHQSHLTVQSVSTHIRTIRKPNRLVGIVVKFIIAPVVYIALDNSSLEVDTRVEITTIITHSVFLRTIPNYKEAQQIGWNCS